MYAESFGNDASETIDVSTKQTANTYLRKNVPLHSFGQYERVVWAGSHQATYSKGFHLVETIIDPATSWRAIHLQRAHADAGPQDQPPFLPDSQERLKSRSCTLSPRAMQTPMPERLVNDAFCQWSCGTRVAPV